MREIKFRGKGEKGKWYFGDLIQEEVKIFIRDKRFEFAAKVDPETVGEFTGLQDANGVDIYEGDIIESVENATHKFHYVVFFDNSAFRVKHQKFNEFGVFNVLYVVLKMTKCKVIGNIHDNPELLKEGD